MDDYSFLVFVKGDLIPVLQCEASKNDLWRWFDLSHSSSTRFLAQGVIDQYVLIRVQIPGKGACAGLSEIRFEADNIQQTSTTTNLDEELIPTDQTCISVNAYPNPFTSTSYINIHTTCKEMILYRVIDLLGRKIQSGVLDQESNLIHTLKLNGQNWKVGTYFVTISQGQYSQRIQIIKS